jgi:hypothetical protein
MIRLPENQNQNNDDDEQANSTADIHNSPVGGDSEHPVAQSDLLG